MIVGDFNKQNGSKKEEEAPKILKLYLKLTSDLSPIMKINQEINGKMCYLLSSYRGQRNDSRRPRWWSEDTVMEICD
ncbi:uncharacterized protein G2W53_001736 [Senna tora]|uniref:Uncharacterized protein n=1 Tax=Senna tora TaxID=362788 RepID=A0A835CKK5_9FABA|nr:uncharacterized protein G2W53_001736 [Senna tora]